MPPQSLAPELTLVRKAQKGVVANLVGSGKGLPSYAGNGCVHGKTHAPAGRHIE